MDFAPGFWKALERGFRSQKILITHAVFQELSVGTDPLTKWIRDFRDYVHDERACESTQLKYRDVGKAVESRNPAYKPAAVYKFHEEADPWIIAHALAHGHAVVSLERPNPHRTNKVSVPDICQMLRIECIDTFELLRTLGATLELR